jgi:hypothetical protein
MPRKGKAAAVPAHSSLGAPKDLSPIRAEAAGDSFENTVLKFDPSPIVPDPGESEEIEDWLHQLDQDAGAVQVTLRTACRLLQSESISASEKSKCVEIIKCSGMLSDTEIPASVVEFFGFSETELNQSKVSSSVGAETRRDSVLRKICDMGSGKTCLRYIVALMNSGRKDLLQTYLDRLRSVH